MSLACLHVLLALSALAAVLSLAGADDGWCSKELCGAGIRHVACNTTGDFHRRCTRDAYELVLSAHNKAQFVHEHNRRRNFVALGQLNGYYPAARMATMVWDDELQYLASLNVRTCKLDHDDCHNTFRFANVGQNLVAVFRDRNPHVNISSLIEQTMTLWFEEYDLIDYTYIDEFKVTKYFEDYGHFCGIVVDRNTHVGCAMIQFTRPEFPDYYIYNIVCNYASVYALGAPVYEVGQPASHCKTGRNPFYPGLCRVKEPIDPNY